MPYRALGLASMLLVATLFAASGWLPAVRAQAPTPDSARVAAAKEMMDVAGVARQLDQMMPLLVQQLTRAFVAVAPDKADEIRSVFSQLTTKFIDRKGELIDKVAGLYAEHLTLVDLNAIASFYRSPAGTRFIAIQPLVTKESMQIGQRRGSELGREIEAEARRELKKRGIEL
jgi:hypothetical protein